MRNQQNGIAYRSTPPLQLHLYAGNTSNLNGGEEVCDL